MSDELVDEVRAALDPTPAHEADWPVSRRRVLQGLASVGALSLGPGAASGAAGTASADQAFFSNYGTEQTATLDGAGEWLVTIDGETFTFGGDDTSTIGLPDGGAGRELVTPSGASASEVIGPGGSVVFDGSAIPDSGVSRWTFDDADTDSGTATDIWNGYDGTINGATTGVSGIAGYDSGQAYDFDGTDDNVNFGTISELSGVSSFSLSAWFNLDTVDTGSEQVIFGNVESSDDAISIDEVGGNIRFIVENSGTRAVSSGDALSTDTTYHAVLTYGSSSGTLYLDGSSVASASGPSTTPSLTIYVADGDSTSTTNTDGVIDDPRVYDKELTSTEVSNLYNTGSISG